MQPRFMSTRRLLLLADVHDKATRSRNMAAIKGRDTKPEIIVRRGLHTRGLRFRLHRKDLPGCPDLVFPRKRVALFVHGCFWHAHRNCRYFKLPETNTNRWRLKLEANRLRDAANEEALRRAGWTVIVIWECELRGKAQVQVAHLLDEIARKIRS